MSLSFTARIEAANQALLVEGDLSAISRFFAPDYVVHLTEQDITGGHQAILRFTSMYRQAFSDVQLEVEILAKSKDRVAWQRTVRATHVGAFGGFPATGKPIVWRDMLTSRFQGGLIAEEWLVSDLAERFLLARKR